MQYLGSISWGFALVAAPFGYLSELEGTNTDLQKLSPPQSPLKAFHVTTVFLHRGPMGAAREVGGSFGPWCRRGPRAWHQTPVELGTPRQFSIHGPVGWPSSFPLGGLALPCSIVALTSPQVLPTDGANYRVPIWGAPFTVDVSKPKPNRPNTMNLVKKRARELGLCEDAFNGREGSSGNWIVYSVVGGKVNARPGSSAEDDFFFFCFDTPPIELPWVFRIAVPLFMKSPWLYILLFSSS